MVWSSPAASATVRPVRDGTGSGCATDQIPHIQTKAYLICGTGACLSSHLIELCGKHTASPAYSGRPVDTGIHSRLERQYLVRCLYLVRYHCSMLTHAKATERHSPRSPKYSSPNFSSRLRPSTSPAPHESSVEWFNIAGRASPSLQLAPKPLELAHVGRVRADPGPHYMRWRQVDARMLLG